MSSKGVKLHRDVYMDALAHLYTNLPSLPVWYRQLTPGQLEDVAKLLASWKPPNETPHVLLKYVSIPRFEDVERDLVLRAIQLCNGDVVQASRALNMGKTTIYRKLKSWGQDPKVLAQAAALGGPLRGATKAREIPGAWNEVVLRGM